MKILSITAGAANMLCGSCLRDNALAAELMRLGHEVILVPLYTPTRTDEANVSYGRVFFGGVSIYLQQRSGFFRRRRRRLDALLDAPWLLRAVSGRGIGADPRTLGALTLSVLEGEHGPHRKEVDRLVEWLRREPAPDVISLPYPLLISLAGPLRRVLSCSVCCTLQGEELFLESLPEPYRSRCLELIRAAVSEVDAYLAVSEFAAANMAAYLGIPKEKIQVVPLGINLEGHAPLNRPPGGPVRIGYLARIAPEKGLHLLSEAYRQLRSRQGMPPMSLEVAGYLGPEHKGYFAEIEGKMRRWGLEREFHYHGEVSRAEKIRFLQGLDVFSVPCTYDEPKGLFLLEAMANGVPVVQPRRGSFPEILEKTGGGILVEPDAAPLLADGIGSVLTDPGLAARLRTAGPEGVRRHFSARDMALKTLEVFSGTLRRAPVNT